MFEVEIMQKRPMDGEYKEINFGVACDLVWVLFRDQNYDEWVGKFDKGNTFNKKIEVMNNKECLLLANGYLYIIEMEKQKIIKQFENTDIYSFIISKDHMKIITEDCQKIMVYDFEGTFLYRTDVFSLDGIVLVEISGKEVIGNYNDASEEWGTFIYNYMENTIKYNWEINENRPTTGST